VDSNSRFRWLSAKRADFCDFPFAVGKTDKGQRSSAVPEKDWLGSRDELVCVCSEKERVGMKAQADRAARAGSSQLDIATTVRALTNRIRG
jgi:hypothetical protein